MPLPVTRAQAAWWWATSAFSLFTYESKASSEWGSSLNQKKCFTYRNCLQESSVHGYEGWPGNPLEQTRSFVAQNALRGRDSLYSSIILCGMSNWRSPCSPCSLLGLSGMALGSGCRLSSAQGEICGNCMIGVLCSRWGSGLSRSGCRLDWLCSWSGSSLLDVWCFDRHTV